MCIRDSFQPFPGQLLDALYTGNGIYQSSVALNPTQTGAPQFPKILPTSGASLPTGSPVVAYSTSTFRNPYSIQYNVAVEPVSYTHLDVYKRQSNGYSLSIPVTLVLTLGPALSLSTNTLAFTAQAGGQAPSADIVTVSTVGVGNSVSFTATSNQPWLTVTQTGQNTPATLSLIHI